MYKETLQRKRERLEALRSRRREGDLSCERPAAPDEQSAEIPRPADELGLWIHRVMDSVRNEKLGETEEQDKARSRSASSLPSLGRSQLREVSFPPQERICYSKESQTWEQSFRNEGEEVEGSLPQDLLLSKSDQEPQGGTTDPEVAGRILSETEKAVILESDSFLSFLHRSSRITERLLAQVSPSDDIAGPTPPQDSLLSFERTFFEDRRCRQRTVTGLDWSAAFPELLASSYSATDSGLTEFDGICLVWNLKYRKETPEMHFSSPSPALSVSFLEHSPHLLVAGTYSGQIVLWDSRSWKPGPVMKSPLSTRAHTAPVHCVKTIGPRGAEKLVSLSGDGVLCWWSPEQLGAPVDRFQMRHHRVENMTASCFDFFHKDVSKFTFGAEDGAVLLANAQHPFRGVKDIFKSHVAPVTGVSTHRCDGPVDFYHLFLTSSMDWSVALWSTRDRRPLRTFADPLGYVYDVQWSPRHPAVFAAVNDIGALHVWDLNKDQEVSISRLQIRGEEPTALNKLSWHSSGSQIATGDAHGRVHVCGLQAEAAQPCDSDWTDLERSLTTMRAAATHGYLEDSPLFTEEDSSPRTPKRDIRSFFGNAV